MVFWSIFEEARSCYGLHNPGISDIVTSSSLLSWSILQFLPDEQGTFMEWNFDGVLCHGVFKPVASIAIFNFSLPESMVTITYRILDANSTYYDMIYMALNNLFSFLFVAMAVCIVDVDNEHTPTIQYGNM